MFEDRILARGRSYTDEVEITQREDGKVTAVVSGTEDYDVEITFDEGLIDDMHCSCPYFDIDNCKHLAALLYVLEDEDEEETVVENEDFKELFDSVSDEDLKDFLFNQLEEDSRLLNRFKLEFSNKIDAGYYRSKLFDICFEDDNRGSINGFLSKDMYFLMEKGEYGLVLDLLDDVFPYVMDWWNYWEDYGSDGNMEGIRDIACELINTPVHEDLFEWLGDLIYAIPSDDHMDDLIDLYFAEFKTKEELEEKLALTEKLYRKTQKVRWIAIKIDLMGKLGYSDSEINDFRKDYLDSEEIMKQYISVSHGSKKEELLLRAISQFEYNREYKVQLKDYYLEIGSDRYNGVLEDLVFSYPEIEYFREFKACFNGDWEVKRSEIFDRYRDSNWYLNECYAEEGLCDLLIANISQPWELDEYYDVLVEDYSSELIEKYSVIAINMASRSGTPKYYEKIAGILKVILDIPGGKDRAVEIAKDFKVKYKRRPRMLQVLREAGF